MDYFAVGGRPLLSRFPPHLLTQAQRLAYDQEALAAAGYFPPQLLPEQDGGLSQAAGSGSAAVDGGAGGYPEGTGQVDTPWPVTSPQQPRQAGQQSRQAQGQFQDLSYSPFQPEAVSSQPLHAAFDTATEVRPWVPENFELIRKLQDATRNHGHVHLMRDLTSGSLVAVKQMPKRWVRTSHAEFVAEHPSETELPWQDVGCVKFLNNHGFAYGCTLEGVFVDDLHVYVVTSFATEGDLFSWCEAGVSPGLEREAIVQPLARQIMEAVQQLHDLNIVHRDLSLENILLTTSSDGDSANGSGSGSNLQIRIIDFSMASTMRQFRSSVRGKASYQAPELHGDQEYDAFLSDVFSLGVTLYACLLKDYPWLSTRPGGCKCFEYVRKHGFRSYLSKRKLRNSDARVTEFMSEPVKQLLEGMLALDPAQRLTLGESAWRGRRSIWDESWMQTGPG